MKKQLKKCLAAVLSLAMTVTMLPAQTAGQVQAADTTTKIACGKFVAAGSQTENDNFVIAVNGISNNGAAKAAAYKSGETASSETTDLLTSRVGAMGFDLSSLQIGDPEQITNATLSIIVKDGNKNLGNGNGRWTKAGLFQVDSSCYATMKTQGTFSDDGNGFPAKNGYTAANTVYSNEKITYTKGGAAQTVTFDVTDWLIESLNNDDAYAVYRLQTVIGGFNVYNSGANAPSLSVTVSDEVRQTEQLLHYDMSHTGTTLTDISGKNNHAVLKNFKDSDFVDVSPDDAEATKNNGAKKKIALNFGGNNQYVEIPNVLKDGSTEAFTIEAVYTTKTQSAAWLFTLGTTVENSAKNYLFVSPYSNQGNYTGKFLGAIKDASTEYRYPTTNILTGDNEGGENIVSVVFNHGTVTYYLNGEKTADTTTSIKIQDLLKAHNNNNCMGYIGRSLWSPDPYFKGTLLDFKVYKGAMTSKQVQEAQREQIEKQTVKKVSQQVLNAMLGNNENVDEVVEDLSFPSTLDGVSLKWESGNTGIIDNTGKIVASPDNATPVEITVTGTKQSQTVFKKVFTVKVIGKSVAEKNAFMALDIDVPSKTSVKGSFVLPSSGKYGSKIQWEAKDAQGNSTNVVTIVEKENYSVAQITRPDADTNIKLTAKLIQGQNQTSSTKEFQITIKAKDAAGIMTDYVFAYFIGDGKGQEKIYLAASRDGLNWEELNGGEPILESTMGEKGLRDPFIFRSHDGTKFYLIATDLCIGDGIKGEYNSVWDRSQRDGSQSIMIWESTDLVNWGEQRMVEVSAGIEAGCTWAPEVYYDENQGKYMLFWASKVQSDSYAKQRLYYCTTEDFVTFSEPEVWIDESHSTIDTTVVQDDDGTYYRFNKWEGNNFVYLEKSGSTLLGGPWTTVNENIVGGVEGPCCFRFNDDDVAGAGARWCLLVDNYGAGGYFPMVTNSLASGEFTRISAKLPSSAKPRHGTVMNITENEYKTLVSAKGTPSLTSKDVPNYVGIGYELPEQAEVSFAGLTVTVPVTWEETYDFTKAGKVTVTGTIQASDVTDGAGATGTYTVSKDINVIEISDKYIYFIDSGVGSWNSDLSESGMYNAVKKALGTQVRNDVPDQLYTETSGWGFVNDTNFTTAGNRTSSTDSIYENGWWAKGGKDDPCEECEYIIPLENGTYKAIGYFQEWWGGDDKDRSLDFYAEYVNSAGDTKTSEVKKIAAIGDSGTQHMLELEFDVEGVTGTVDVHFHAKNAEGTKKSPVISGLAIEKKVPATSITLNKSTLALDIGDKQTLTVAESVPANADKEVTWRSDDPDKVSVDSDTGEITALAEGDANITATAKLGGATASCKVTVSGNQAVTSVKLDKTSHTMIVNDTLELEATVLPDNATDKSLEWSSSDENVVEIDQNGKATAKAKGTAEITVKAKKNGISATCKITVREKKSVTGIGLDKTELNLVENGKETLTVTFNPKDADNKNVTWSFDEKVVTVNKDTGEVTAVKAGKTTITVTSEDNPEAKATCNVTVTPAGSPTPTPTPTPDPTPTPVQKVTKVTLSKTKLTIGIKENFTLKATPIPADAVKSVSWSVDKKGSKIVKLNTKTGKITGKKKGKATVTVTVTSKDGSSITAKCAVTVKPAPTKKTKISVKKKSITVKAKKSTTLKPTVKGNYGSATFKFTSKNKKVAKVDANGKVTGVKKGKTTITIATYNKKAKTTVKVTVK